MPRNLITSCFGLRQKLTDGNGNVDAEQRIKSSKIGSNQSAKGVNARNHETLVGSSYSQNKRRSRHSSNRSANRNKRVERESYKIRNSKRRYPYSSTESPLSNSQEINKYETINRRNSSKNRGRSRSSRNRSYSLSSISQRADVSNYHTNVRDTSYKADKNRQYVYSSTELSSESNFEMHENTKYRLCNFNNAYHGGQCLSSASSFYNHHCNNQAELAPANNMRHKLGHIAKDVNEFEENYYSCDENN
ncbi:hypothetical protein I4U23_010563 [Adineta vaga]|nr:hypothetical protein I4U23_010563 [Adineta vaga]